MKTSLLSLLLSGALLAGCAPAADVKSTSPAFNEGSLPSDPDSLIRIADEQEAQGNPHNAVTALERALSKPEYANTKAAYEAQWRLARAYAELSEPEGNERWKAAPQGLAAAKRAVELAPDRIEGHYYLTQLIGYSALLQKGDTKQLIRDMVQEGDAAVRIDEKFDHGGPVRVLGGLYAGAPKEPVSVGDPEKAIQYMKRAVAADADYPPNHIYLAEAYIADERYQEADSELGIARKLLADSRWAQKQSAWKEQLSRVEHKLRAKQP